MKDKSLNCDNKTKIMLPMDIKNLNKDQHCAYDIVDWHLNEMLAGRISAQLLMVILGEGGVGKSKLIQTMTQNFWQLGSIMRVTGS
jgi:predicted ATP-dependent serine protease